MNPITLSALTAFWATVLLYVILVTAKNKTKLWRWVILLAAGLYSMTGCMFLLATVLHYPSVWGWWAFGGVTVSFLLGVTADYLMNLNIPPAIDEIEMARVAATRLRAQFSLLAGGAIALLIVTIYALNQPAGAASAQTAQTVRKEADQTRAHIDSALSPMRATLDTIAQRQQMDHQLLMQTTQRSLDNENRLDKNEGQLTTINRWLRQWGNKTFSAIERTRRSIITPAQVTPPGSTTPSLNNRVPNRF